MNLQRREEIRELIADKSIEDPQALTDCRNALTEALAHIDTLEQTAAERVIADGSRGPTPDYTGEGSAWVPPVETLAVVVPELTDEDYFRLVQSITCPRGTESVGQLLTEFIREHSRAIPAGRVPGDGMVAVDREEWSALRGRLLAVSPIHNENQDGCSGPYWECRICGEHTPGEYESKPSAILLRHSTQCPINAIRANQGGADARKAN